MILRGEQVHPIIARLLEDRGLTDPACAEAFIDPDRYTPATPDQLPDLSLAVSLLVNAIRVEQTILIWGDFDVDGQTASALLLEALVACNAKVHLHIPDRVKDSHGIQTSVLREKITQFSLDVLLTCDTGVTAYEAVQFARDQGLTVIVTDHHELGDQLPNAHATLNPRRLPSDHPLGGLPGVGVAYLLMQALYKALSRPESDLARSLELVALGIVADVAPQYGDTRYLLQRGLIELQRTTRPGLLALFQTARLADGVITATKIGFQIAPRLNAASRLGNVQLAIELLTTPDSSRAVLLAEQLNALNTRRRDLQRLMEAEITEQIKADPSLLRDYTALVIYGRDWQQGLLGPVAGRLAETYQRPVVLFSAADLNERELRGSARSAGSYHLVEGLAQVDHLLITYGGHAGAAGLSLQREQLDRFRQGLSLTLSRQPPSDSPIQITTIPHPLAQVTPQFARQLNWLAPFGEGNREPVFLADGVHIDHADFLDRAHDHRKLRIAEGEATHEVYWWGSGDQRVPKGKINLEYTIEVVKEKISLTARRVTDLEAQVTRAPRKLIDHRTLTDPAPQLSDFYAQYPDLVIWAEGFSATESPGVGRGELLSGLYRERPLLIYTIPPAGALLSAVINGVDPPVVILCGHQPLIPNLNKLRTLLGGVVNFVVNKQNGLVKIESLCIRTAQTEAAVKAVLTLFYESGDLDILRFEGDQVRLGLTDTPHRTEVGDLRKAQSAFAESQSYRAFYRSAPLTALIPERVDDEYPLPDPRADSPY